MKVNFIEICLLIIAAISPFSLFSQDNEEEDVEIIKLYDRREDKIIIEFTNDMWLNLQPDVKLRPYSPGFNLYLFSDYQFGKSPFSLAWGLGISSDNVHSNAAFILNVDEEKDISYQALTPYPEDYEYTKSKFVSTYIDLPIELRLISQGEKTVRLSAGFKIGYMVSNHYKIIDTEGKAKYYDLENINHLHYGLTARMGFSIFALTGFYSLTPLINDDKGSALVPFSLGIAIMPIK